MASSTPVTLRATRSVADVLNVTFQFIRVNAAVLAKSLLYLAAPPTVLSLTAFSLFQLEILSSPGYLSRLLTEQGGLFVLGFLAVLMLSFVGGTLGVLAVLGVIRLYESRGPDAFTVADVWGVAKRKFLPLLATTIAYGFVLAAPVVVVIVPCLGALAWMGWLVYAGVAFSLVYPIRVMEENGLVDAFGRSRRLVRGAFGQTTGIIVLAFVTYFVLSGLFNLPATLLSFVMGLHAADATSPEPWQRIAFVLASIVGNVGTTMLYSIPLIAAALQYFNLVEQKERVGLMDRVERLDAEAGADAPAADATDASQRRERRNDPDVEEQNGAAERAGAEGETASPSGPDARRWGRGGSEADRTSSAGAAGGDTPEAEPGETNRADDSDDSGRATGPGHIPEDSTEPDDANEKANEKQ